MYTIKEFKNELIRFYYKPIVNYDDIYTSRIISQIKPTEFKNIYEKIKNLVPIDDIYKYLTIYSDLKFIFHSDSFDFPRDNDWDIQIYKSSKELPNLTLREIFQIFKLIYICFNPYQYRYYNPEIIISDFDRNRIYEESLLINRDCENIFSFFLREVIRINNDRVSKISLLWWEQYSNCYTKWIPQEIVEDIMFLLNENSNYLTLVE